MKISWYKRALIRMALGNEFLTTLDKALSDGKISLREGLKLAFLGYAAGVKHAGKKPDDIIIDLSVYPSKQQLSEMIQDAGMQVSNDVVQPKDH